MSETCENCLGLVNSCVYYVRQTHEIYQILFYWIWKLPVSFAIHRVRQYLLNVVLFGIKDLHTSEMTVKLKSNACVGPVNIFPNFSHWVFTIFGTYCKATSPQY